MFAHFILACGAAVVSARAVVEVDAKGGYGNQLFEFASCRALALIMNHVRHHDHGPGAKLSGGALPTCLARPWAAAWELYVAHATSRNYAAHLVPRPCAEKLSGDCLPAACAD